MLKMVNVRSRISRSSIVFMMLFFISLTYSAFAIAGEDASDKEVSIGTVSPKHRVGGPCTYRQHPGTVVITRIVSSAGSPNQVTNGGGDSDRFEVYYTFTPDRDFDELWARQTHGKEQLFRLMNDQLPGALYLERYKIAPGVKFRASVRLITSGTCTPIIFELDGVRRDDYFEGI